MLARAGVVPDAIWLDFETGAYLRNRHDREKSVRAAMEQANLCPRCVKRFGRENLSSPERYQDVVDRSRAYAIRVGSTDPVRRVFAGCKLGNFYAYPVRRLPNPPGRYPAYGWRGSGMDVARPRCFMVPGRAGALPFALPVG